MIKYNKKLAQQLNNLCRKSTIRANQALAKMPRRNKYLAFGRYTRDCPKWFLKKFDKIDQHQLYSWFLADAFGIVFSELDRKKFKVKTTKNWRKSRFISAKDILRKRLRTCASLALLTACGLRYLGIPTKLIHGYLLESKEKFRHAWNEIYFPDYKKFLPMDMTRLNYKITDKHIKMKECVDWSGLDSPKWDVVERYKRLR